MRTLLLTAAATIALLGLLPSVQAQYTFQASGVATLDDATYRIGITRHPDAQGFPTYGLGIVERQPTAEDPFNMNFLVSTTFYVVDNFNTSPTSLVGTSFFAIASDPAIDFALSGIQHRHTITATGHYFDYEFIVTADSGA